MSKMRNKTRNKLRKFVASLALVLSASVSAAFFFPCNGFCVTPDKTVLTHVEQVVALSNAEAAKGYPFKAEATVTYARPSEKALFVMENGYGVYVRFAVDLGLTPGDRVSIEGKTAPSFRPIVISSQVRFLSHGTRPPAQPARFEDLIRSKWDARLVEVTGTIQAAALDASQPYQSLRIRVQIPDGLVEGIVEHPGKLRPEDLLDAEVRLTGVAGGAFDSKMQMAGVWLDIDSWKDVTVLHGPAKDPWSEPINKMNEVVYAYRNSNESKRSRIAGTLTYFEPGTLAVIEQNGQAMLIETRSTLPLHAGVGVEASGFPVVADESLRLDYAQLRAVAQAVQVQPRHIDWEDASVGHYAYNLVSMDGEVVAVVHDSRVDLFVLQVHGHLFSAAVRQSSADVAKAGISPILPTVGSKVTVTGVCFVDAGNVRQERFWFDLRMRSLADIVVTQPPSWWTVKRLAYIITVMGLAVLVALCWVWMLERRLRAQSAILALRSQEEAARERRLSRQEQRRSHILELISSSEPLPEVLREIRGLVSARLGGAACWFELNSSGGRSANLERPTGPGMVFQELFSPEGISLGFLLATPLLRTSSDVDVSAGLRTGARLAELAIDTRRLYSDLRHRSEHDLLTDIPNRFSLEKHLNEVMLNAQRTNALFGLIYVDLDRFKQVNDRYGHRTGDLYLQAVTRRMRKQLRSEDILARIGGDEFIALVPVLQSHEDADEIARRLDRSFEEPFEIDGHKINGSASVGLAVFPQDGSSKEELQRFADAAMYVNKEAKHRLADFEESIMGEDNADVPW
jgi:diguanylate cyclase (GGDEF)-like protein